MRTAYQKITKESDKNSKKVGTDIENENAECKGMGM